MWGLILTIANYCCLRAASRRRMINSDFLQMDARNLSFKDQRFDLILLLGVLHHMDDQLVIDCCKQVNRVLKNGGYVFITEPIFSNSFLSNFFLKFDQGKCIRTTEGYRDLLSGFNIVKETFLKRDIHTFCSFVLTKQSL
jgi:ubiquinone/menaquinone biosynthesis C-methylase UbiE